MRTALISGALANKPFNGGNAWSRLSWISGMRQLGFEVYFVEQISRSNCVDAAGTPVAFQNSANVAYFRATMDRFGLSGASALICEEGGDVYGMPLAELIVKARNASLLFNISGHLAHPDLLTASQCRVYYDDDPGYTQFWHATGEGGARLSGHDFFFTLGHNIGSPDCTIPTGGIPWKHTRPPVVLDEWRVCPSEPFDRFTTIASWRGAYGPAQHGGKTYGLKAHEFRKYVALPRRSDRRFEIALQIHPADGKDLDALRGHGWHIVDPRQVAASTDDFRTYVQTSGAEFSVAQGVYVETNSGWFSDRTVRYLASGKPALVQDTGIARHYPVGQGLLTFRTMGEAIDGAARIVADYETHCRVARRIAEEYFDAKLVIRSLMTEIGLS